MLTDLVTSPERRAAFTTARHWDASTLPERLGRWATERPDRLAVVDDRGVRRTFRELQDDTVALARRLLELGVAPGDVVSVQMPNRCETATAALAVLGVGAVLNPLLPNYRGRELAHAFRTARPRVIVTPGRYRDFDHGALVEEIVAASGVPVAHLVAGPDDDDGGPTASARPVTLGRDASAVSEVIFTSGTEATPKAIMHTEQTTNFSVRAAVHDLGLGDDDVVWMPSPVGHSTGFNYGLRLAVYQGLPLVLQDRWDPGTAAALVDEHRCSYTLTATTFLHDLVQHCQAADRRLDSLRFFGCGGAPVPPGLVTLAAASGIRVLRLYGSTEVLVATWCRPDAPLHERMHTDGRPMSHLEVELRDGELFTRGPNTCVGFFADPERTASTFHDGWVASGDLVEMDERANVTVVGRKKEIIIRGGMNIAPREIEDMIAAFEEVDRVAVVGLPDPRLGERMCACVVLRGGASLDLATCVDRLRGAGLATYKLPQALEVLPALPTTASGKVQKHEILRTLAERGAPRPEG